MTTRTSPISRPIDVPIPRRPAPRIPGRASLLGLACALVLAGSASTCAAQGTIYYSYNNNTTIDLRAVSASGSNDRLVYKDISVSPRDGRSYGVQAACSHASHHGALAWVVTLDDDPSNGVAGNPFPFTTLYQVTTSASGGTALVRLSDFDFTNRRIAIISTIQGAAWAPDDSFLSFVLADFSGATPLVKIVRFPVANLVTNGGVLIDETNVETVLTAPCPEDDAFILQHSWSPDATTLAYRNLYYPTPDYGFTQLILRELATGTEQVLVDEGVGGIRVDSFEYAPDGTRIAFEARGQRDIDTIAIPSGALHVVAASTVKNGYATRYVHPVWSPDSSGLAVEIHQDTRWGPNYDVAKVPSGGGAVTALTPSKTRANGKAPRAWR